MGKGASLSFSAIFVYIPASRTAAWHHFTSSSNVWTTSSYELLSITAIPVYERSFSCLDMSKLSAIKAVWMEGCWNTYGRSSDITFMLFRKYIHCLDAFNTYSEKGIIKGLIDSSMVKANPNPNEALDEEDLLKETHTTLQILKQRDKLVQFYNLSTKNNVIT